MQQTPVVAHDCIGLCLQGEAFGGEGSFCCEALAQALIGNERVDGLGEGLRLVRIGEKCSPFPKLPVSRDVGEDQRTVVARRFKCCEAKGFVDRRRDEDRGPAHQGQRFAMAELLSPIRVAQRKCLAVWTLGRAGHDDGPFYRCRGGSEDAYALLRRGWVIAVGVCKLLAARNDEGRHEVCPYESCCVGRCVLEHLAGAAFDDLAATGFGVSISLTAASDALLAAAPAEQAGAAAAVEETAYELGAGLGVTILGSVATLIYTASLPGEAAQARDGLTEATAAAAGLSPEAGSQLLELARAAFVTGLLALRDQAESTHRTGA